MISDITEHLCPGAPGGQEIEGFGDLAVFGDNAEEQAADGLALDMVDAAMDEAEAAGNGRT